MIKNKHYKDNLKFTLSIKKMAKFAEILKTKWNKYIL
jgi:hypothetical protein